MWHQPRRTMSALSTKVLGLKAQRLGPGACWIGQTRLCRQTFYPFGIRKQLRGEECGKMAGHGQHTFQPAPFGGGARRRTSGGQAPFCARIARLLGGLRARLLRQQADSVTAADSAARFEIVERRKSGQPEEMRASRCDSSRERRRSMPLSLVMSLGVAQDDCPHAARRATKYAYSSSPKSGLTLCRSSTSCSVMADAAARVLSTALPAPPTAAVTSGIMCISPLSARQACSATVSLRT